MKFLYCPECNDAVLMHIEDKPRYCRCGKSWGRYTNEIDVLIGGAGFPFGINNHAFELAAKGVLFTFEGWWYRDQKIDSDNIHHEESEETMGYLVQIIEKETDTIADEMEASNISDAIRIKNGISINLNHDEFWVDVIPDHCTCENGIAEGVRDGIICSFCKSESRKRHNGEIPF